MRLVPQQTAQIACPSAGQLRRARRRLQRGQDLTFIFFMLNGASFAHRDLGVNDGRPVVAVTRFKPGAGPAGHVGLHGTDPKAR